MMSDLPTSATPDISDDERFTLGCYERSRTHWQRVAIKVAAGGVATMYAEDSAQRRAARWYAARGGYKHNAVEALHLIGHAARVAGGTTINGGITSDGGDERVTGWLAYLVHLGIMLDEWGLAIGPLIELADRWAQGEECPINLAAAMVDLTVMFTSPVSVRAVPAELADEMRRPAFAAMGILTTAVIHTARSYIDSRASWAKPWPDGVTTIGQFSAAVDLICGGGGGR